MINQPSYTNSCSPSGLRGWGHVCPEFSAHATATFFMTSLDPCVLQSCFVGFGDPSGVVLRLCTGKK